MHRLASVVSALLLATSATSMASSKKFVPPPMPAGYDDPGAPPTDPLRQIATALHTTLKDAYSAREFSLCSSRVQEPMRVFSPTDPWERAQRLVYFLVNAKNSYGAYTGVQEGIASFRDGKLIQLSLVTSPTSTPTTRRKCLRPGGTAIPCRTRIYSASSTRQVKSDMADVQTQREKFEQAARDLGCDEDERRWDERLRKVAAHKPKDVPADQPTD